MGTYEVSLEDCRIPAANLLGEIGKGFAPMQTRLTRRRLEMAAWSIGIARRAVDMLIEQANQRTLFGTKLADKQAIQWWIADLDQDSRHTINGLGLCMEAGPRHGRKNRSKYAQVFCNGNGYR